MGKLVFAINVSIDGCCDHSKFMPGEDVHDYFAQLTREADILLYGRKTYQLMVPFWPDVAKNRSENTKALNDFAQAFVSVPQIVVVSTTLKKSDEPNTTIVRSDLQNEIIKLKKIGSKVILTGGIALPSELIKLNLVDEIRLVVHPYVVGHGRRLFDELELQANLKFELAESQVFESGAVVHRYLNG